MIFDSLKNASIYYPLSDRIKTALQFLEDIDPDNLKEGKIEIDGENIFALVQKYKTKDSDTINWESHRKYIDIQYMVEGSEDFGFVNCDYLNSIVDYDEEKDCELYEGEGDYPQLNDDEFIILFPEDVHKPGLKIEKSESVLKIVVKVKVD